MLENSNQKSSDSGIFDVTRSKEIIDEIHKNHKHTPISWGNVNGHTLGPLLDAYEDTIKEKEEIIQNYELELYNFSGKNNNNSCKQLFANNIKKLSTTVSTVLPTLRR